MGLLEILKTINSYVNSAAQQTKSANRVDVPVDGIFISKDGKSFIPFSKKREIEVERNNNSNTRTYKHRTGESTGNPVDLYYTDEFFKDTDFKMSRNPEDNIYGDDILQFKDGSGKIYLFKVTQGKGNIENNKPKAAFQVLYEGYNPPSPGEIFESRPEKKGIDQGSLNYKPTLNDRRAIQPDAIGIARTYTGAESVQYPPGSEHWDALQRKLFREGVLASDVDKLPPKTSYSSYAHYMNSFGALYGGYGATTPTPPPGAPASSAQGGQGAEGSKMDVGELADELENLTKDPRDIKKNSKTISAIINNLDNEKLVKVAQKYKENTENSIYLAIYNGVDDKKEAEKIIKKINNAAIEQKDSEMLSDFIYAAMKDVYKYDGNNNKHKGIFNPKIAEERRFEIRRVFDKIDPELLKDINDRFQDDSQKEKDAKYGGLNLYGWFEKLISKDPEKIPSLGKESKYEKIFNIVNTKLEKFKNTNNDTEIRGWPKNAKVEAPQKEHINPKVYANKVFSAFKINDRFLYSDESQKINDLIGKTAPISDEDKFNVIEHYINDSIHYGGTSPQSRIVERYETGSNYTEKIESKLELIKEINRVALAKLENTNTNEQERAIPVLVASLYSLVDLMDKVKYSSADRDGTTGKKIKQEIDSIIDQLKNKNLLEDALRYSDDHKKDDGKEYKNNNFVDKLAAFDVAERGANKRNTNDNTGLHEMTKLYLELGKKWKEMNPQLKTNSSTTEKVEVEVEIERKAHSLFATYKGDDIKIMQDFINGCDKEELYKIIKYLDRQYKFDLPAELASYKSHDKYGLLEKNVIPAAQENKDYKTIAQALRALIRLINNDPDDINAYAIAKNLTQWIYKDSNREQAVFEELRAIRGGKLEDLPEQLNQDKFKKHQTDKTLYDDLIKKLQAYTAKHSDEAAAKKIESTPAPTPALPTPAEKSEEKEVKVRIKLQEYRG